jgi:putative ABC transport system substrate-binding protein
MPMTLSGSFDVPKGTLRGAPPVPDDDLTTLRASLYLVANKKLGTDLVAIMFNPDTAPGGGSYFLPSFEAAAQSLHVTPIVAPIHDETGIEETITMLGSQPGGGLVVTSDGFMVVRRAKIISLVIQHKLPVISDRTLPTERGGLLSYGPVLEELFLGAALYADRILRGAKPAELPVQVPTKFEMRLNLKTAEILGLTIPSSIIARADEVIE